MILDQIRNNTEEILLRETETFYVLLKLRGFNIVIEKYDKIIQCGPVSRTYIMTIERKLYFRSRYTSGGEYLGLIFDPYCLVLATPNAIYANKNIIMEIKRKDGHKLLYWTR